MIIRFVRGTSWESTAIAMQEKTAMPFTPSHVEALTQDQRFYIGAHIDGGVEARPVGYDRDSIAKLLPGYDASAFPDGLCDMRITLPADAEREMIFNTFMQSKIGTPYDMSAILGFISPEHHHAPQHAICSALVTMGLRACGWFPFRLAAPEHLINPRDLLLMLSTHMQIQGV